MRSRNRLWSGGGGARRLRGGVKWLGFRLTVLYSSKIGGSGGKRYGGEGGGYRKYYHEGRCRGHGKVEGVYEIYWIHKMLAKFTCLQIQACEHCVLCLFFSAPLYWLRFIFTLLFVYQDSLINRIPKSSLCSDFTAPSSQKLHRGQGSGQKKANHYKSKEEQRDRT